jgi:hypothetical protein
MNNNLDIRHDLFMPYFFVIKTVLTFCYILLYVSHNNLKMNNNNLRSEQND